MYTIKITSSSLLLRTGLLFFVSTFAGRIFAADTPSYYFPNPSIYTNGPVRTVLLVGETLYVGGDFSGATGTNGTFSRSDLVAYDLTTGSVLPFAANTDRGMVRTIAISGDRLVAGGTFSKINGVSRSRLAAVNRTTGEVDALFRNNPKTITGDVWAVALTSEAVYIGGSFTEIDGVARNYLAAVDRENGDLIEQFDPSPSDPMDDSGKSPPGIYTLAAHPTNPGVLFAGGNFREISGNASSPYLAALFSDGSPGPLFESRVAGPVTDLDFDGDFLCASVGGMANRVYAFGINTNPYVRFWRGPRAQGDAQAVAIAPEGYVYFGFHQGLYDTTDWYRLAVLDANTGTIFDNYPSVNSFFGVRALDIDSRFLVAGGEFTRMNDLPQKYLAVFSSMPFERGRQLPLDVPVPVTPRNGTIGSATDLTVAWKIVARASSYHVQLAADSGFTRLVLDTAGLSISEAEVTGLNHASRYWWRVCAHGRVADGAWSEAGQFSTMPGDADKPVIIAPVDDAVDQLTAITFIWRKSRSALSYQLQVSNDPVFASSVLYRNGITDTTFTISDCGHRKKYYWRVRAETPGGSTGWTSASFTTIVGKPGVLHGVAPADKARQVSRQPVLRWNSSRDAEHYHVQISIDSSFGVVQLDSTAVSDSMVIPVMLDEDTRYFWRVVAHNAGGEAPSPVMQFTTRFSCPMTPVQLYPEAGAVVPGDSVICTWGMCSPYVTMYHVVVAEDSVMKTVLVDTVVADTVINVGGLKNYGNFWWEVRACNETGWSGYSTKKQFRAAYPARWVPHLALDRLVVNGSTGIVRYSIAAPGDVVMALYNLHGVPVWSAVRRHEVPGPYSMLVPAGQVSSGKYFLVFRAGEYLRNVPALLVR